MNTSRHSFTGFLPGLTLGAALLAAAFVASAQDRPETQMLSEKDYPIELEEIVVRGQAPTWRERAAEAPRWEQEKFRLPIVEKPSRIEILPRYTREEREDYEGVRDRNAAKPRIKLFEVNF